VSTPTHTHTLAQVHDALASMEAFAEGLFAREAAQRDPAERRHAAIYDQAVGVSAELSR